MDVFSFFIFWMPKHQVQLPSTRPGALDVTAQLSTRVLMHENAKLRPSPDIQENHHSSHRAGVLGIAQRHCGDAAF